MHSRHAWSAWHLWLTRSCGVKLLLFQLVLPLTHQVALHLVQDVLAGSSQHDGARLGLPEGGGAGGKGAAW
jgi:hypothetical protein